jgi:general secretion pathway protein G
MSLFDSRESVMTKKNFISALAPSASRLAVFYTNKQWDEKQACAAPAISMRSGKGFTLIELMVVIAILGILAGLVLPRFMGRTEEAKKTKARIQIENLEGALKLYKLDNGTYPTTEQGLEALVQKPATGVIPKNWREGGYLEKGKVPLDPWGNGYVYLSPGVKNKDFDLKALGADGEEGGEGDNQDIER